MAIEPRCPYCNVSGLDKIATQSLGNRASLVFCNGCGAIYGVVPLALAKPSQKVAKPSIEDTPKHTPEKKPTIAYRTTEKVEAQPEALTVPQLAYILKYILNIPVELTLSQATYMTSASRSQTEETTAPICQQHWYHMIELIVPKGLPKSGKSFWVCPGFLACKQWIHYPTKMILRKIKKML